METRKFNSVFTTACHLFLSRVILIQSVRLMTAVSIRKEFMLPLNTRLGGLQNHSGRRRKEERETARVRKRARGSLYPAVVQSVG